jgi:hypothetical protein
VVAGLAVAVAVVLAFLSGGESRRSAVSVPGSAPRVGPRSTSGGPWQPLKPGQYLHFRQLGGTPNHNGPATLRPTEIQDIWIGANGFARIVQTGPDTVIAGGDVLILHATPAQLQAERERQRRGAHLRILSYRQQYGGNLNYQQMIHLPTDPASLERFIEQHARGDGPRFSDIFSYAENLLLQWPLPPKVSAALYRAIVRLPGMRRIGPARDQLGRPGVAVGLFFKNQPGRIELILDPRTGALLGERSISLDPSKMHAPAGAVTSWSVIYQERVVDSDH